VGEKKKKKKEREGERETIVIIPENTFRALRTNVRLRLSSSFGIEDNGT
jgi:hypothetical protein